MGSPWLPKGHVEGRAQGPEANSEYDATSILSTTKDLFGLKSFLTKRDAWAGSFSHLFQGELRTDCPMTLPDAPETEANHAEKEALHPTTTSSGKFSTILHTVPMRMRHICGIRVRLGSGSQPECRSFCPGSMSMCETQA